MSTTEEAWQRRIRDLYANVGELYSHLDITVVVFDRDLAEVSPADDPASGPFAPQLAGIARRVLATGDAQRDIALDQSGRRRAHAFPLRDADSIVGVACIVDDDGARRELFVRCALALFDGYRQNEAALLERERRALEEAQRANRLRDLFLATVAHELRSPMSSIMLWEQVLRDPSIDEGTRTSALDAIRASASGQSLLVDDLLDVSRAINGKLRIERRLISLHRVLMMTIEEARQKAQARSIAIEAKLDPDLGHVLGDPRRLRQIFDNVLSNAVKCTDHGRVTVVAQQTGEWITIDVSDTGRGIAPDFLPHIFEPFRQADAGPSREGLGLGLGIARQLVTLHGGTMSASSEGLGRGARFTMVLRRAPVRATTDSTGARPLAGVRALIVDDDMPMLDALQLLLRASGAIVTTATSASSAYAILEHGQIDIVLSDIAMPGEDGYSLVQRMRASADMRWIPVIAMSGQTTDESRDLALAAGFDRYLMKPVALAVLISNITELV